MTVNVALHFIKLSHDVAGVFQDFADISSHLIAFVMLVICDRLGTITFSMTIGTPAVALTITMTTWAACAQLGTCSMPIPITPAIAMFPIPRTGGAILMTRHNVKIVTK